jgi:DnaJ-class molecular chaperone
MDFNKNYYALLGVLKDSSEKEIKKRYYSLSFTHHPDKGGDALIFAEITEAYNVLCEYRNEYDKKSRFGSEYDESTEFLNFEFDHYKKGWDENRFEDWKKDNQLNIVIYIDEKFDGTIEYNRYMSCKNCAGSGKDLKSKIQIKDDEGNILKIFEGTDGCDFCEGSGKDPWNRECSFCGGKGKVGSNDCLTCLGEKRILGKQKLKGIKFPKDEKAHKIDFMGNNSKDEKEVYGHLWLVKKD